MRRAKERKTRKSTWLELMKEIKPLPEEALTEALKENYYNTELLEFYDVIGLTNEVVDKYDETAEKEWKAYNEYLIFMTGHGLDEDGFAL